MSVLDKLDAASGLRRTVTLVLDAALDAEWNTLRQRLDQAARVDAQQAQNGSLADPMPNSREILEEMEAIRDRVAASEVTFTFEHLDWTERVALQALHPPRKDNVLDRVRGYNVDTFIPAVIRATCLGVCDNDDETLTPVPEERWQHLIGPRDDGKKPVLNYGQVQRLYSAATAANEAEAQVPISARSLLETQDSGASLAQPGPGTSPRSDSKAGNRPTSPKSSGTKKGKSSAT